MVWIYWNVFASSVKHDNYQISWKRHGKWGFSDLSRGYRKEPVALTLIYELIDELCSSTQTKCVD